MMMRTARSAVGRAARGMVTDRTPLHALDNVFTGTNGDYLDQMFDSWCQDPASVSQEMRDFFEKAAATEAEQPLLPENLRPISPFSSSASGPSRSVLNAMRVGWMLRLWAVRGHRLADLDPLKLNEDLADRRKPGSARVSDRPLFHPSDFGFSDSELDQVIHLAVSDQIGGLLALDQEPVTLRQLYTRLREIYAGKVGWEYMHIHDAKKLLWLRKRIETPTEQRITLDHKEIFHQLARAELFEKFLQVKFTNVKRFGLDGAEVLIPGMLEMIERSAELGVEAVVMGMPHRGRLNVLANVAGKPFGAIFGEFQGSGPSEALEFGSGDVKYHLGFVQKKQMRCGKEVSISLAANPSHLEAVSPVVQGKTKAKQLYKGDTDENENKSKVMSVVMHGDAAFAGQGVCFESMGLSDLKEYDVGGTVHIIVNNQIGFTTDPVSSRSTPYCSDLGKAFGAPIFHVNADATAEVIKVFKLAAEWRAKYQTDVIIDLICYRRYGHNESDEPLFTQPLMYQKIAQHPTQLKIYGDKLVQDGLLSRQEIDEETATVNELLKEEFKSCDKYQFKGRSPRAEWLESFWKGFKSPTQLARIMPTAIEVEALRTVGRQVCSFPETFTPHNVVKKIFQGRAQSIEAGQGIDWPTAESLAFATLLQEGNHVRLSGQDVERGTFSQRHAGLHDQVTGEQHFPLDHVDGSDKGNLTIQNSSLSEFGVLGFELGFSSESPNQLVIWEAQFGDFANTAQVIFDQFLSSGEVKWYRQSGMVVNLPHGMDGAGPEHSSGRLERFLQMTAEPEENPHVDPVVSLQQCNWQVVYPTTPAQYFHVLRRQVHRDFRKPLICFFAKSTLRAPNVSSIEDFAPPTEFQPVIDDDTVEPENVKKLVLCTGQIWFALNAHRNKNNVTDMALVRIEQLSPFPWFELEGILKKYPSAEVIWCQEESKNMGAWLYAEVRLESMLEELDDGRAVKYVGRRASAAPATGHLPLHEMEHQELITSLFG